MKTFEIVLLQGAQKDILALYTQRGESAYRQVDKALEVLRVFPEIGPVKHLKNIRRLIVSKTTLGIFYSVTGKRVLVGAVLDLRQSPRNIDKRLKDM